MNERSSGSSTGGTKIEEMKAQMNVLWVVVVGIAILVGILIGILVVQGDTPRVAYIQIGQVYQEFALTKELEAKYHNTSQSRQTVLDSLQAKIIRLDRAGKIPSDSLERLQRYYLRKEQKFQEDGTLQTQQYDEQIWKQLNQYIQDFQRDRKYNMVLGANGRGSIMAADSSLDITEAVLSYINHRYSGGN